MAKDQNNHQYSESSDQQELSICLTTSERQMDAWESRDLHCGQPVQRWTKPLLPTPHRQSTH